MRKQRDLIFLGRRDFLRLPLGAAALAVANPSASLTAADSNTGSPAKPLSKEARQKVTATSFRTFESGFHNGPTVRLDRLDPEAHMARVREANTEVVIIETKSHWGYAYYNSKVGTRHPSLDYDLVVRWVEAGHRNGLTVLAYYSGQIDLQASLKYPSWIGRNADGSVSRVGRHWYWNCHHSPYRPYALGMYREIFSQYDIDGLFIDGAPSPRWLPDALLCYCSYCQEQYGKDIGESFLQGIDTPQGYRKRIDWFRSTSEKYLDEVYQLGHSLQPGIPIWHNQGSPFDMPTQTLRKAACLKADNIDSPSGLSIISMVMRGWRRPSPQFSFFWDGYSREPLERERFRIAAVTMQGARPKFVTDQQNMPDGRMRPEFYEVAGSLQSEIRKFEGFLKNLEPIPSLGVLFSEPTRDHVAAQRVPAVSYHRGPFVDSIANSLELLTKTRYPVEVLPQWRLTPDVLAQFDLLVLPETEALAEAEGNALREYVHKGGILLATGKSGLFDERGEARSNFLLADVMGVDYVEEVRKYAGKDGPGIYLQSSGHPLADFLGSGEVAILGADARRQPAYCPFLRVRGSAESLFDYRLPYLVPDLDRHIFQTWNPAPPGNEKVAQAATVHRYGQGHALYVGLPLFNRWRPGLHWIEEWVCGVVQRLVPAPGLRVEGRGAIHAAFYRQGEKQLVVQMVNSAVWTSDGEAGPARDLEIVGRSDRFPIRSARLLWPQEQELSVVRGPHWRVRVPEVAIYSIVAIRTDDHAGAS